MPANPLTFSAVDINIRIIKEEPEIKNIPYGKADFAEFKERNLYYVDKTRYIHNIENKGDFLFLIRPRRFGKSLFLSILEHYYDIELKDQFDYLFKGTDIHKNPTPEKNRYLVLKFNFAMVDPAPGKVEEAFLEYIKAASRYFLSKYRKYLDIDLDKVENGFQTMNSASVIMNALLTYCMGREQKLIVIIDEYDNFANTILSTSGQLSYLEITHGEGFLRSFFNVIKGGTTGSGAPISRLFMSGVSPITLDDVTSGFNILTNISLDSDVSEILGFSLQEVETMIDYYQQTGKIHHSTPELLQLMSRWYNHYRFSLYSGQEVFNTVHVLYFLREYMKESRIPDDLIDHNARIDYNKLRHLIIVDKEEAKQTNGNFSKLLHIIEKGDIHSSIKKSFPIEAITETDNFVSLLYYFGLLTIQGIDDQDIPILAIPNEAIKKLYYDYIHNTYKETGILNLRTDTYQELMRGMAYKGKWQDLIKFIADCMETSLSLRDLMTGEKAHQVFWNAYLGLSSLYTVSPEK